MEEMLAKILEAMETNTQLLTRIAETMEEMQFDVSSIAADVGSIDMSMTGLELDELDLE